VIHPTLIFDLHIINPSIEKDNSSKLLLTDSYGGIFLIEKSVHTIAYPHPYIGFVDKV
jgi:hypothetical protein